MTGGVRGMTFRGGLIHGFLPRFQNLDADVERYLEALVDLQYAGQIALEHGRSGMNAHYEAGRAWIIERYFEEGRMAELEAYLTPVGETFFAPIYEGHRTLLDRMLALGEAARVRRVWRAHLGLLKGAYWDRLKDRARGFEPNHDLLFPNVEQQRRDHEAYIGRIPEMKATLLEVLAGYRALLAGTGASAAEIARIDADVAAVQAEARAKPQGKRDGRAMNEDVFWELIDHGLADASIGERLETLPERIALFKPAAIRKFDQILGQMDAAAYRTDVWALAYLLQGGCSDDAFDAFRGWLILQGRVVFEATLADPDGFDVALHGGEASGMDALREAAAAAYDLREGRAMRPVKIPPMTLGGPEIEEHEFAVHLPLVAAAIAAAR